MYMSRNLARSRLLITVTPPFRDRSLFLSLYGCSLSFSFSFLLNLCLSPFLCLSFSLAIVADSALTNKLSLSLWISFFHSFIFTLFRSIFFSLFLSLSLSNALSPLSFSHPLPWASPRLNLAFHCIQGQIQRPGCFLLASRGESYAESVVAGWVRVFLSFSFFQISLLRSLSSLQFTPAPYEWLRRMSSRTACWSAARSCAGETSRPRCVPGHGGSRKNTSS